MARMGRIRGLRGAWPLCRRYPPFRNQGTQGGGTFEQVRMLRHDVSDAAVTILIAEEAAVSATKEFGSRI